MQRRGFTLIEFATVVAIAAILAAILLPVFGRTHCNSRTASCQSNLKQIALGLFQYREDYDRRFPPVGLAKTGGWVDSVHPYTQNWGAFQCPSAAKWTPRTTDYFFNSRVAALEAKAIAFSARTVLLGDGGDDSRPNSAVSHLPQEWRGDEKSPAMRHDGNQGANYAFADGHAKWLRPESITSQSPSSSVFTFAVRGVTAPRHRAVQRAHQAI